MIKRFIAASVFALAIALGSVGAESAEAFQGPGCMGKCTDCHNLSKDEAGKLLMVDRFKAQIKGIKPSPVKGLWEVEFSQGGNSGSVYIDFGKKFLIEAKFTPLEQLSEQTQFKKVDLKKIPLDNAILMGSAKADKKVIIFDDPECPYCAKLHEDIIKILKTRKDIAFYIKLYPLPMHPDAYEKSKVIVCGRSAKLLDDAFSGRKLPKAECDTQEIDNNIKLAEELGIRGTPAIILPDGRLVPGALPSEELLKLIDKPE